MWFWKGVLTLMFVPVAGVYHVSKLLLGREKAHQWTYQKIVGISAKVLSMNIPTLREGESFRIFSQNFQKALSKMPFETIDVSVDTDDQLQLHITRCQFTEVFQLLGISDLTQALCDGDEEFCTKYQPHLTFTREHRIQKGDDHCDHTFTSHH